MDWLRNLGPRPLCLAPMVEMGDLAFRIMVRRHEIKLCWTGMINTNQWNLSRKYRGILQIADCDTPLVCQISGSISSDIISAALSVAEYSGCAAIDINLGCCQTVAKRGEYGYFMVDSDEKRQDVIELIKQLAKQLPVPLFVKIRILENEDGEMDLDLTVNFARELERVGAKLITVHGRPPKQDKGGDVNLECIKRIVESVRIPVIANGGILNMQMANDIMEQSGAYGAMIGQALLKNPTAFDENGLKNAFEVSREYLQIYQEFGGAFDAARRHLFYFLDDILGKNGELRARLGKSQSVEELLLFIAELESNCK